MSVSGAPVCTRCGRAAREGESVLEWSYSREPRPTGFSAPAQEETNALCPECLRRHVRDVEARLDP